MSMVKKADWKSVVDLVTNAKLVVSSVQDAARNFADYAKLKRKRESSVHLNRQSHQKGINFIPFWPLNQKQNMLLCRKRKMPIQCQRIISSRDCLLFEEESR